MKKILAVFCFLACVACFTPTAEAAETWGIGIYSNMTSAENYSVPTARRSSRKGSAICYSVMGIVNWGNCGLNAAMRNGRISKVNYADWNSKWIILYGTKTLTVYGE